MKTKQEIEASYERASSEWERLDRVKTGLKRSIWEQCAELTLPYLFTSTGTTESSQLYYPYNSIGTYAVNNLSAKLTAALLPTTTKFFRLLPFKEKIEGLTTEDLQNLEKELSDIENDISTLIAIQGLNASLTEAIKLLIVTGNALIHKIKGKAFKVFNPKSYCVERDYAGNVMSIYIKEKVDIKMLPKDFIDEESKKEKNDEETIYTCIIRQDNSKWLAYQEVDDKIIDKTIVEYKDDTMPYIALRWNALHNEDYGRGLVEQHLGDLRSLEALRKAIVETASITAKVIFGVKKGATLKAKDLQDAQNGDVILGDFSGSNPDVTVLQVNKAVDLQTTLAQAQSLEQSLGKAFLLFSSTIRDSERTTMAEVRETSSELDAAFGGTFSVLANELQVPLIRILLNEISPEALKITTPSIVTTANSISRQKDIENLNLFLGAVSQFGPEFIQQNIKIDSYLKELATAIGIDGNKLVKSAEEKQAEQQALMQQQAMMEQTPQEQIQQ